MKQLESKSFNLRQVSSRGKAKNASVSSDLFFDERDFCEMLNVEMKRSQRSMKSLILMRLDISGMTNPVLAHVTTKLIKAFTTGIRDTDIRGWFKQEEVLGILFTDIESVSPNSVMDILFHRVMARLASQIDRTLMLKVKVTFLLYTKGKLQSVAIERAMMEHHTDLVKNTSRLNFSATLKSVMDMAGNFLMK